MAHSGIFLYVEVNEGLDPFLMTTIFRKEPQLLTLNHQGQLWHFSLVDKCQDKLNMNLLAFGPIPVEGLSRKIMHGLPIMAKATQSFLLFPPESFPEGLSSYFIRFIQVIFLLMAASHLFAIQHYIIKVITQSYQQLYDQILWKLFRIRRNLRNGKSYNFTIMIKTLFAINKKSCDNYNDAYSSNLVFQFSQRRVGPIQFDFYLSNSNAFGFLYLKLTARLDYYFIKKLAEIFIDHDEMPLYIQLIMRKYRNRHHQVFSIESYFLKSSKIVNMQTEGMHYCYKRAQLAQKWLLNASSPYFIQQNQRITVIFANIQYKHPNILIMMTLIYRDLLAFRFLIHHYFQYLLSQTCGIFYRKLCGKMRRQFATKLPIIRQLQGEEMSSQEDSNEKRMVKKDKSQDFSWFFKESKSPLPTLLFKKNDRSSSSQSERPCGMFGTSVHKKRHQSKSPTDRNKKATLQQNLHPTQDIGPRPSKPSVGTKNPAFSPIQITEIPTYAMKQLANFSPEIFFEGFIEILKIQEAQQRNQNQKIRLRLSETILNKNYTALEAKELLLAIGAENQTRKPMTRLSHEQRAQLYRLYTQEQRSAQSLVKAYDITPRTFTNIVSRFKQGKAKKEPKKKDRS